MGIRRQEHATYDPKNPDAIGVCDRSGLHFNHKDLVRQMEWRGNNLVWTGLLVGRKFLDVPSEQMRQPPIKDDPRPVKNPRLDQPYIDVNSFISSQDLMQQLKDPVNAPVRTPLTDAQLEPPAILPYPQLLQKLRQMTFNS
jgi:hypothetical protein